MNKFYLYYSLVTAFVCMTASIVFSFYRNIQGGIWADLAALIAGWCFLLHCLHFSNKLQYYFNAKSFDRLNVISFVIVLLCSTFFIWYFFTAVYWKIPLFDYERTPVFPCVFSFISGKWGLHLYYKSKEYSFLYSNFSPLIQTA